MLHMHRLFTSANTPLTLSFYTQLFTSANTGGNCVPHDMPLSARKFNHYYNTKMHHYRPHEPPKTLYM